MNGRVILMVAITVVLSVALFLVTYSALEKPLWSRAPQALEERPAVMWETRGEEFILQAFILLVATSASAIIVRIRGGGKTCRP